MIPPRRPTRARLRGVALAGSTLCGGRLQPACVAVP